jgi:hypothetical protein
MDGGFQARMVGEGRPQPPLTPQRQQGLQEVSRGLPGEDPGSVTNDLRAPQPLAERGQHFKQEWERGA